MDYFISILFGIFDVCITYPHSLSSVVLSVIMCISMWIIVKKTRAKTWFLFAPTIISGFVMLFSLLVLLQGNAINIFQTLSIFLFSTISTMVCLVLSITMIVIKCLKKESAKT